MPNQPRPDNPARQVRVEDSLWHAAGIAAAHEGTTRAAVIRQALDALVDRVRNTKTPATPTHGDDRQPTTKESA